MFIHRATNHKVNLLHEDYLSSYDELLQKDNSVTVHTRNIQLLAIEIYKVKHKISPYLIREIFPQSDSAYNLKHTSDFKRNTSDFKRKTSDFKRKTSDFKRKTCDFKRNTSDFKRKTCDFKRNTSDFERKTSDFKRKTSDFKRNTSDFKRNTSDFKREY